jgi:hypothetical protein
VKRSTPSHSNTTTAKRQPHWMEEQTDNGSDVQGALVIVFNYANFTSWRRPAATSQPSLDLHD